MLVSDQLRQHVVYALRGVRREPGVAIGIITTFALAIGANAAMFGLIGRLMIGAPPGVRDPDRVAQVTARFVGNDGEPFTASTTSYPVFQALQRLGGVFSAVAAIRADTLTVGRGADLEEVAAITATGDYFDVLGARAHRGRLFTADDDALPTGNAVVVLSHRYWQRRFGGDASVLGSRLEIGGEPFTVVGVTAPEFTGERPAPVDVFVPFTTAMRSAQPSWSTDARLNLVGVLARVRDGVDARTAEISAVGAIRAALEGDGRAESLRDAPLTPLVAPRLAAESPQGRTMLWLTGVAVVVLLIATANVATLLLLRGLRRRREIGVRIALGAGRGRLAAQLLIESLILALAGSAAGLVVARWLAELIRATLLPNVAPSERLIDPAVLAATLGVAVVAGLLAGCAPLAQAGRRDILSALKSGGDRGASARSSLRSVLVGLQVALCTLPLVGAGLFLRSLERVRGQDLGFSTNRLLFVTLDVRSQLRGAARDELHRDAARRLTSLPGVTGATVAQAMPFGSFHVPPIAVPGMAEPPSVGGQLPFLYGATPEFLRLMNVRLVEGRLLTARDVRTAPLVVLVNETFARRVWPGQSAVGKCIRFGHDPSAEPQPVASPTLPCREIVGVVRDSRARSLRPVDNEAGLMQYYVPFDQLPAFPFADVPFINGIVVQSAGDADAMISRVRRLVQSTSAVPVYARVRPYQDLIDPQLRPWRLGATLFTAFATLALAIASVGLFGVVSYLVTQRTREIGVRLALGGTRGHVRRVVVLDGVRRVAVGVIAGVAIALAAAPFAQPMLFQTSAREPLILVGAALALLAVAVVAAMLPAWRASRVSPVVALGAE